MKKGAMFGLDARIAIAIFGALSVISGAALYSSIQKSNAILIINDLAEAGKAWEQFYLDTGVSFIPKSTDTSSNSFYTFSDENLVRNTANTQNWKGPYLNYSIDENSGNPKLVHQFGNIYIHRLRESNLWGDTDRWNAPTNGAQCTSGEQCFIWSILGSGDFLNESMVRLIDEIVDGDDSPREGKLKWAVFNGVYAVFYKIAPINNPHD